MGTIHMAFRFGPRTCTNTGERVRTSPMHTRLHERITGKEKEQLLKLRKLNTEARVPAKPSLENNDGNNDGHHYHAVIIEFIPPPPCARSSPAFMTGT